MKKILLIMLMLLSVYTFGQKETTVNNTERTTKLSTHYIQGSKVDSLTISRPVYNKETEKKEMKTSSFVLKAPSSAYWELTGVMIVSFLLMFVWFNFVKESEKLALRLVAWVVLVFGLILAYSLTLAKFENVVFQLWAASILSPAVISVLLFICADDIQRTVRNIFIAVMIILQAGFFIYLKPDATEFFVFSTAGIIAGIIFGLYVLKFYQKSKRRQHARK